MREVFINLADFDILVGRLSKGEREGGVGGGWGGFFRRFRSQKIFKYTSAVRSKICRGLLYAWC